MEAEDEHPLTVDARHQEVVNPGSVPPSVEVELLSENNSPYHMGVSKRMNKLLHAGTEGKSAS